MLPAMSQAGPRFLGVVKQLMLDHWGWNLPNLVNAAHSVWQRTSVKWGKRTHPWSPDAQVELAIVNYSGSGNTTARTVSCRGARSTATTLSRAPSRRTICGGQSPWCGFLAPSTGQV